MPQTPVLTDGQSQFVANAHSSCTEFALNGKKHKQLAIISINIYYGRMHKHNRVAAIVVIAACGDAFS